MCLCLTKTSKMLSEFIDNEIISSSIFGGFQIRRGKPIYRNHNDNDAEQLKSSIRKSLLEHIVQYENGATIEKHIKDVISLADNITDRHQNILANDRFRIGISQKILGLYLKYLWALGQIPEPPVCPFDRTIIDELGLENEIKWTELDDEDSYRKLVYAARARARESGFGNSLARWELYVWQNRD